MPIQVPSVDPNRLHVDALRNQAKLVIEACTAPAVVRVHSDWKLKLDLGKTVSLLIPEGETKVHGWMIGCQSIKPITNANGDAPFVGSKVIDRVIELSLWGFFDAQLKDPVTSLSGQTVAEREAERVADTFKLNHNHLGFDSKPAALRNVLPMSIDNLDSHDFSDGVEVFVAQCILPIVVRR